MKKKIISVMACLFILITLVIVIINFNSSQNKKASKELDIDFKAENIVKEALNGYLKKHFEPTYQINEIELTKESFVFYDDSSLGIFLARVSHLLKLDSVQNHPIEKAILTLKNEGLSDIQREFLGKLEGTFLIFLDEYSKILQETFIRFRIFSDSEHIEFYIETPKAGTFVDAEEALAFKSSIEIYEESIIYLKELLSSVNTNGISSTDYNPQGAIKYALSYTSNTTKTCCEGDFTQQDTNFYNEDYDYYSGNDCANFVSQSIHAGGIPFDNIFYPYSVAWRYVDFEDKEVEEDLFSYILEKYASVNSSQAIALPGSIIFADWNKNGSPDHAMLLTYNDGYLACFSAHTSDRKNTILPAGFAGLNYLIFR